MEKINLKLALLYCQICSSSVSVIRCIFFLPTISLKGYKMYQRKELYPSKKRWLVFILPGTVLALIGLIFTAALETEENYYITHSMWHICIGLSALFLLPPKPTQLKRHASERELLDVNAITTQNADGPEPYSFMTGE